MGLTFPLSLTTKLKFDSSNNVLANVNAQNINPNVNTAASVTGAVGSVTNPIIASTLLSHQTGLSVTATAANTMYAIGSAISVSRTGILRTAVIGHVNTDKGFIMLNLTRGTNTYSLGSTSNSLFVDITSVGSFSDSSPTFLIKNTANQNANGLTTNVDESDLVLILNVYAGDSLQFYASNNTASEITYIDDLLVIEQ